MSKLFYDHLVIFEEIESEIKNISETPEEKEELWSLVDEIVNHRLIIAILDRLPIEYHEEFLTNFHEAPYSLTHLSYLNDKVTLQEDEEKIEDIIQKEIKSLEKELLGEIRSLKKKRNG